MLKLEELRKRLIEIEKCMEEQQRIRDRLRVKRHRYKKMIQAWEDIEEDVFDESD